MTAPLTPEAIEEALTDLKGWTFEDDRIFRTWKFGSFPEAMAFLVRVGFEAEEADHHPEIYNVYSTVRLSLNTHDVGGKVTERDLKLAMKIQAIAGAGCGRSFPAP
ncbi:MAG: 4a-hydroxytetrahydrobiopterin dehydratase [Opitutales bacterium]